ncbi:sensor histidine kinase [Leisingera caerulea]|uniref:sensor histidine kinase n=1 Tax=Leisingera caerulea TaxID=506591 RepID=UPI001FE10807|nr:ATP-binding protein [Leisingera caerulea]
MAERYQTALAAYIESGDPEQLGEAYETARLALEANVPLPDFGLLHFAGLRNSLLPTGASGAFLERAEDFFLEGVAVYDMALRGYVSGMASLRKEIAERRRVEQELRDITFELARQRDELDREVRTRTTEIRLRAEELEGKNRQLVQANQEQSNFTYALSHDLKTPINTLYCFLEVLLEDYQADLKPEARELISDLIGTAARMRQLVDDVLDYSKIVGHQFTPERVDLQMLVRQVLKDMDSLAAGSQAEIRVGALPVVMGSPFQIRVLLTNLLSNALTYGSSGQKAQVRVECAPAGTAGKVRLSVSDNGPGIPEDMQERIFELFKRLHRYDQCPGSGIGLALCKRVAETHGTELRVISESGKGAAFSVDLNLEEMQDG